MTIEARAKVNFTLEVLGRRADGYHAIRSLVYPLVFGDTLHIEFARDFSTDTGYGEGDLALKATRALAARCGGRARPVAISIEKRIPAGGGLGGGSADAAATLVALNEMWGAGLADAELAAVGAQVGSDVPSLVFAQRGVPVLMEGRGEIATPLPDLAREFHIVLAMPGVSCPTAEVYANCISRMTDDAQIMYNMRRAIADGDIRAVAAAMVNDLAKPATALRAEVAAAADALLAAGAAGAAVSGSGSTVFGLAGSAADAGAIAEAVAAQGLRSIATKTYCPVV